MARPKTLKKPLKTTLWQTTWTLAYGLLATACGSKGAAPALSSAGPDISITEPSAPSSYDLTAFRFDKLVCNPFESASAPQSGLGLKAELYYLADGRETERTVFLPTLDVRMRPSDKGFQSILGEPVSDTSGNKLTQNFGLRMKSTLKLAPDQEEGLYEFALLNDDHTEVTIRGPEGTYAPLVTNEGKNPVRLGCGQSALRFARDTEIPIEVDYQHAGGSHVALVLLMRKVSSSTEPETACGDSGNGHWFDQDAGGAPKEAFLELEGRGWLPLKAENFALTLEAAPYNPCAEGPAPVVSDLDLYESQMEGLDPELIVSWQTDLPSTGQLLITNTLTGEATITASDNLLRTRHSIAVKDLDPESEYTISAFVVSNALGKGLTRPRKFKFGGE